MISAGTGFAYHQARKERREREQMDTNKLEVVHQQEAQLAAQRAEQALGDALRSSSGE